MDIWTKLLEKAKNKMLVSRSAGIGDFNLHNTIQEGTGTRFNFESRSARSENMFVDLSEDHYLSCLAFALAVCSHLNLNNDEIACGLRCISQDSLRQRRIRIGKYDIFDDTYSSSPESAIAVLRSMKLYSSNCSCVLGDMLELGDVAVKMHEAVGEEAAIQGFSKIYAFGKYAHSIAVGAMRRGAPKDRIYENLDVSSPATTTDQIKSSYDGELLLIKGSHAIHTERIIALLSEDVNR